MDGRSGPSALLGRADVNVQVIGFWVGLIVRKGRRMGAHAGCGNACTHASSWPLPDGLPRSPSSADHSELQIGSGNWEQAGDLRRDDGGGGAAQEGGEAAACTLPLKQTRVRLCCLCLCVCVCCVRVCGVGGVCVCVCASGGARCLGIVGCPGFSETETVAVCPVVWCRPYALRHCLGPPANRLFRAT